MSAAGGNLAGRAVTPVLVFPKAPRVCIVAHQNYSGRSFRSRRMQWRSVLAVFLIAAGGTFAMVWAGTALPGWIPGFFPGSGLSLRAARSSGGLLVQWDHHSRALSDASDAILTIHDGPYSRTLHLDADQIGAGTVLYEQQTGDVTFELKVQNPSGSVAVESLRVLGAAPQRFRTPRVASSIDHATLAILARPPEPPEAKDPPTVRPTRTLGRPAWLDSVRVPAPVTVARTAPVARPSFSQKADSHLPSSALIPSSYDLPRKAPAFTPPTDLSTYIPPLVVREVKPDLRLLRTVPLSPVTVQVQVSIDEVGRIIKVSAVKSKGKTSPAFTKAALRAARQWRFEPAMLHGKQIPSEHTILFEFRPSER